MCSETQLPFLLRKTHKRCKGEICALIKTQQKRQGTDKEKRRFCLFHKMKPKNLSPRPSPGATSTRAGGAPLHAPAWRRHRHTPAPAPAVPSAPGPHFSTPHVPPADGNGAPPPPWPGWEAQCQGQKPPRPGPAPRTLTHLATDWMTLEEVSLRLVSRRPGPPRRMSRSPPYGCSNSATARPASRAELRPPAGVSGARTGSASCPRTCEGHTPRHPAVCTGTKPAAGI